MALSGSVQRLVLVAGMGMVLAVTGCQGGPPGPPGRMSAPPTMISSRSPDLRIRLARGLESESPQTARWIRDAAITVEEVELDGLTGWTLVDVQSRTPPHPRRITAALSDSGEVKLLSGDPEAFNSVVRGRLGEITAGRAITIAQASLDLTRDFSVWGYRVQSIEDIDWLPDLTADQARDRDGLIAEFADRLAPPETTETADGWALTLWTVTGTKLVRHEIEVSDDGSITDIATVLTDDLPVPSSV